MQLVTQWACQLVFSLFLMLMGFEHPEFSLISGIGSLSCGSSPVLLPPPSSTSKQTLSHLSVLTSAVCPVLPASLWLHLKTLFTAKTHYCTINTHSPADTATHRNATMHIDRHKNALTHSHKHAWKQRYQVEMRKINLVSNMIVWVSLTWTSWSAEFGDRLPPSLSFPPFFSLPVSLCPCHHTGSESCAGECCVWVCVCPDRRLFWDARVVRDSDLSQSNGAEGSRTHIRKHT